MWRFVFAITAAMLTALAASCLIGLIISSAVTEANCQARLDAAQAERWRTAP